MIDGSEEADCGPDVDTGYYKFLDAEDCHLKSLDDFEDLGEGRSTVGIGAICQDRCRYVEEYGVGYDHDQDSTQYPVFSNNQM